MPRRPLIAANWKMHLTLAESADLAQAVAQAATDATCQVMIAPPFTALPTVAKVLANSPVLLGAQNACWANQGAFTGEVSPLMLKELGCAMVIVGHSERRQYFNETDASVAVKAEAAVGYHLRPIVCVGETLAQREAGETNQVVETQVRGSLAHFPADHLDELVIAYEPVWAIGTGKVATPKQANEVHHRIRKLLVALFGQAGSSIRVIYGGSVKPDNAAELMAEPDIDGALVGGASLDARSFFDIIEATRPVRASEND